MSKYGVISDPCFTVFGLNTEIYSINLRIQFEYRKIQTRNNSVFGHFSRSDGFDIISISETWLKENKDLINYVQIPGYEFIYNNREHSRGEGVAYYIKEHLQFKKRKDIYNLGKTIEYQWIEVKGKKKFISR